MSSIQQLKERIYALNPELKELCFGCEIYSEKIQSNIKRMFVAENTGTGFLLLTTKLGEVTKLPISAVEILGHPIHLEHVLRAYLKPRQRTVSDHGYEMLTKEEVKTIQVIVEMYNLSKTFDQNIAENEEMVTFLLDIIK